MGARHAPETGATVIRKGASRAKMLEFFGKLKPCLVAPRVSGRYAGFSFRTLREEPNIRRHAE